MDNQNRNIHLKDPILMSISLRKMVRIVTLIGTLALVLSCSQQSNELNLAGEWQLCMDSLGDPQTTNTDLLDYPLSVILPTTLDLAGIGKSEITEPKLERQVMLHLQRKASYIGPAYFRKNIMIPRSWKGKRISLKMERVIWESVVWIDGKKAGNDLSLSTPHYYDLSEELTPGKHTITICIDNSRKLALNSNDMAHAYTEETQIKWNGILGDFHLTADQPDFIQTVSIYPDLAAKKIIGKVTTSIRENGSFALKFEVTNPNNEVVLESIVPVANDQTDFQVNMEGEIYPWNEFSPNLYRLTISLLNKSQTPLDIETETFGFRDLESRGNHLFLNGERLYLRGTLECCIFPLTGHPPVDVAGWAKVFSAAKDYGLNHLRFHSWCPPEAAFEAADQLGVYLQVELPNWSLNFGADPALVSFMNDEADKILKEYGNHPSFVMMSMGNELEGNFELLTGLVSRLKNIDRRHLYTTTTYSFQKGHGLYPEPVDDFFITQNTEKGWIRGQGVFDQLFPDFKTDYTQSIDHIKIPVISHEIGQYSVFPDMKEIEKYTGVLQPTNFEAIRNDLNIKNFPDSLVTKFASATGRFATLLYKEEIERALKTEGLSGFQLLDLHDFPGQGTALVGILDAFWESKGAVESEQWRMFCSEVVPLLWFNKAVYTNKETFHAEYGIANYCKDLTDITFRCKIKNTSGTVLKEESMRSEFVSSGNTSKLDTISIPLNELPAPGKYQVELSIDGTKFKNQWDIWVYPVVVKMPHSDILVTSSFQEAVKALEKGKKVLLSPDINQIEGITGKFVPVFWSPVHFPNQPGTMGLLIDPDQEALKFFPTDFYSNWQWWDLCKNSKTLVLDSLNVDPIVRVIDNFFKNRKMGNVFEAMVGNGRLIFSSIDLNSKIDSRPVARQLKYSLLKYMNGSEFQPKSAISAKQLLAIQSIPGGH
jgi:hypothetical protein